MGTEYPEYERAVDVTTTPWEIEDSDRLLLDGEEYSVYRCMPEHSAAMFSKMKEVRRRRNGPGDHGPKYACKWSLLTAGELKVVSEDRDEYNYIHFTDNDDGEPVKEVEKVERLVPVEEDS